MTIIIPTRPSPSLSSRVSRGAITRRSSADVIRSRLLFKLGIYDPNFTNASTHHKIRCETFAGDNKEIHQEQQPSLRRLSASSSSSSSQEEPSQDQDKNMHGLAAGTYLVPLKFAQDLQGSDGHSPHLISSNPSSTSSFSEGGDGYDALEPPASINDKGCIPKSKKSFFTIQFDPSVTVIPVPSHRSHLPQDHAMLYTPREEMASSTVRNTREFIYEDWDWNNAVEEDGMYTCTTTGEYVHPAHITTQRVNPYR